MVDAWIPFFLDRLCDQSRLLDAHSAHYLAIAISAYLTKELEVVEKVERSLGKASRRTSSFRRKTPSKVVPLAPRRKVTLKLRLPPTLASRCPPMQWPPMKLLFLRLWQTNNALNRIVLMPYQLMRQQATHQCRPTLPPLTLPISQTDLQYCLEAQRSGRKRLPTGGHRRLRT